MKNKKIFICILIIFMLFTFSISSFASDNLIEIESNTLVNEGTVYSIPDFSDICNVSIGNYILSYSSRTYHLFILDGVDKVVNTNNNGKDFQFINSSGELMTVPSYKVVNGSWVYSKEADHVLGETHEQIVWRCNIYNPDGSTFFFTTAIQNHLGEIVKEAQLQTTVNQIVTILPLILVVVVSFLGLRKAWTLLSKLLHQA